ncbi:MAG: CehA/McbA family metallohydrolase [Vicinamibacteria bacterium]
MGELLGVTGELRRADGKSYRAHPFRVPAGVGRLRIEFRYDRGGEDPHSLVTLQLFDPAGFRGAGHRFAPVQTIELGPGGATPGFVPGSIPEGGWIAELDLHGVIEPPGGGAGRYELRVQADASSPALLHAPSGEAPAASPAASAAASSAGPDVVSSPAPKATGRGPRRWLRGELHLHSDHSDGRWDAALMARHARGRGLDFLFLTDHNTTTGVEALREAIARELGGEVPVHPGIELTTYNGHALALGLDGWVDWRTGHRGRSMSDVARDVRAAGAYLVIAHPDAPPDDVCTGCRWTHADFEPPLADAVEVWGGLWDGPEERNPGCVALWHRWLDLGLRMTATGATDAHRPEDWQGAVPLTWVEAEDASLPSILAALRAGRSFVSSGPELRLGALGADGRRHGIGDTASGTGVRLRAECRGAEQSELRLTAGGGTLARARVEGDGHVDAPAPPPPAWVAAELWSADGRLLRAITSPVYLR